MSNNNAIKVRLTLQQLLKKLGITKPHQLWLRFGGSKSTAGMLWMGNIAAVQFSSIERILGILREDDPRAYERAVMHLNATGLFSVERTTACGKIKGIRDWNVVVFPTVSLQPHLSK